MATYRDAGVDLEAADRAVDRIDGPVTATWGPDVIGSFGGFAAGISDIHKPLTHLLDTDS